MIQIDDNLERFMPCEDMICYDINIPNDFFNQDYENSEMIDYSISIVYLVFKYLLYLLFGCTLLTLGCSISTLIVMTTDKRNALEDEDDSVSENSDSNSETESDSESEYDETNYHYKYVKELKSLLSAVENVNEEINNQIENEEDNDNKSKNINILELTNEMKTSLSDRILMETTPKGNVIMYYNYDQEDEDRSSFHYYCDDKSLPFNYLDTVSRKYVCLYKCPQIYRYLEKEMEVRIQKMKDLEKKRQEDEDKENAQNEENRKRRSDSVFATLKNYKTQSQNQIISGVGSTQTKRVINPNQLLLCKNRYKRLGSIEEYHLHLKMREIKEQEPVNIKPISFSDYKKMNQM